MDSNNTSILEDTKQDVSIVDSGSVDERSEEPPTQEQELTQRLSELKVTPSSPERAIFKKKSTDAFLQKPVVTSEQASDNNVTPMRGCIESSSNPHYYGISRTMSSPSVIDASPKPSQVMNHVMPTIYSPSSTERNEMGQVTILSPERRLNLQLDLDPIGMIDLTPVIRNTVDNEEAKLGCEDNRLMTGVNLESLSVPETDLLTSADSSPRNSKSTSQVIRPRASGIHYSSRLRNKGSLLQLEPSSSDSPGQCPRSSPSDDLSMDEKQASPPSFSSHRSSASSVWMGPRRVKSASKKVFKLRPPPFLSARKPTAGNLNNNMPTAQRFNQSVRYSSPLSAEIQLDRNCFSFAGTSEFERKRLLEAQRTESNGPHSPKGTPEAMSPPDEFDWNMLQPYQPSRNSSLISFGLDDDLDAIFLHPRIDGSSIIDENGDGNGGGIYSISRRTMTNKSGDQISIPSIGLAHNFSSNTQDSFLTTDEYYYDEYEEDSIIMLPRSTTEGRNDVIAGHDNAENCGQQIVESEHVNVGVERQVLNEIRDGEIHVSSSCGANQEQRRSSSDEVHHNVNAPIFSPKKARAAAREKRVYQWLKTLEVDKDNNEYVAEAASSKFLTGKNISPRTVATKLQNIAAASGHVTNGNTPYGTLPDEPDPTISTSGSEQAMETARGLASSSSSLLTSPSSTFDIRVARPLVNSDSGSTVSSPASISQTPVANGNAPSTRRQGEVCGRNLSSWGGRKKTNSRKRLSASTYRVG